MDETVTETLCDGCQSAVKQNEVWEAEGLTKRRVHFCYRTQGFSSGTDCQCTLCHPTGSFMMTARCEWEAEVKVDLAELIRRNLDRYRSMETRGYEPWERPMNLLWSLLEDEAPSLWDRVDGRDILTTSGKMFELKDRNWSPGKYEALCAVCPEARVA